MAVGFPQTELESIAIGDVLELKAVLDSGAFSSLLTVSVQTRGKNNTSVFVFQCDDVRVRAPTAAIRAIGHKHTKFWGNFFFSSVIFRLILFKEIYQGHFQTN